MAGNTLFVGTPDADNSFTDKAARALAEEHYNSRRPKEKEADQAYRQAMAHAEEAVRPLARAALGEPDEGAVPCGPLPLDQTIVTFR